MDEKQDLIQNLTDAGCGAALKERVVPLVRQGRELRRPGRGGRGRAALEKARYSGKTI